MPAKQKHDKSASDEDLEASSSSPLKCAPGETNPSLKNFEPGRSLSCINPKFPHRDVELWDGDKLVYFVDISAWKRHAPDLTLHANGPDGPINGVSHFRYTITCPKIGMGSDELSMTWVGLQRKGIIHQLHRFEWKGKSYVLSRLESAECEIFNAKNKLGMYHYKVVEEDSGRLVALHISQRTATKKEALLQLAAGISRELEILSLLAIATRREILRRS